MYGLTELLVDWFNGEPDISEGELVDFMVEHIVTAASIGKGGNERWEDDEPVRQAGPGAP